jgi:hypothetical protein
MRERAASRMNEKRVRRNHFVPLVFGLSFVAIFTSHMAGDNSSGFAAKQLDSSNRLRLQHAFAKRSSDREVLKGGQDDGTENPRTKNPFTLVDIDTDLI